MYHIYRILRFDLSITSFRSTNYFVFSSIYLYFKTTLVKYKRYITVTIILVGKILKFTIQKSHVEEISYYYLKKKK